MDTLLSILYTVSAFVKTYYAVVLTVLAAINLFTFILYGLDKRYAKKKKWRISEARLLLFAALYGALGAYLGMRIFRHKTKHKKFTVTVPFLLSLQIAFAAFILLI